MSAPPRAGHYRLVYADPPWPFGTYSHKGKGRSPEAWYDTMSIEEIAALPVGEWAARDAVLLLWTTDPLLPRAFEVIAAWGFTYKTVGFYWAKLRKRADPRRFSPEDFVAGLGFWTRANPELCLLATRGRPKRRSAAVRRLIVSPRREHSRKPDEAYARIEALVEGPYLELFARGARPGWDVWGSERDLFDREGGPRRRWKASAYPEAEPRLFDEPARREVGMAVPDGNGPEDGG
ncbi:MAG TPA: DNA methyltransferase [Rhodospirillales bacterium]|nr:DNA methyltransferase [Rhodospirillales bacterium]